MFCNFKLVFVAAFITTVFALPLEEKELDEIIYRLSELKNDLQGKLAGKRQDEKVIAESKESKKILEKDDVLDSDKNRLLLDYYMKPYVMFDKKNFDEIDRLGFNSFHKRFNKRNFDEIDRLGFNSFQKRMRKPRFDAVEVYGKEGLSPSDMYDFDRFYKRNFDEIDRYGFNQLKRIV